MMHLKMDELYDQLHTIIERQRFDGRLVLAMGSANNVRILQKYLSCYSLKIRAILDNDPEKKGLVIGGCKVFQPKEILCPFKEKALVLIYSPGYADQMRDQLASMGYQENVHFFILKDYRNPNNNWKLFREKIVEARNGMLLYHKILKQFGKDAHILIARGATGDVFLNGLYLEEYIKAKKFEKYVVAGDAKGLVRIAGLFGIHNTVPLNFAEAECLQQCYKFFRCKNVTDLFMWQGSLYFNRCQTRMHESFNFLDTYTYYIYNGIVNRQKWKKPLFLPLTKELEKKFQDNGMKKGKTVIIAPFAYSVRNLPVWFWDKLAGRLKKMGYEIFANMNIDIEINPFEQMKSFFFSFEEAEAVLKYCGYFLALRSGLCDIVSMIPCRQVILYPQEMNPIDYRVHRSDMNFSSFKAMGFDTTYITELSSPVIHDIVCAEEDEWEQAKNIHLYDELTEKVLRQF